MPHRTAGATVPRMDQRRAPGRLSAADFARQFDLPDWRILLGQIEALFRTGAFDAATALAHRIAQAAEAVDHHPDIDVRYPDRVRVVLSTHVAGGLTERDAALATTISALAAEAGATSDPGSLQVLEIAIDAMDIAAVRPFWKAVLGYGEVRPAIGDDDEIAFADPNRIGPPVWFQQMDAARPQRNRIHLDVTVPPELAEERIAAALAAGGTLVSDERAPAFWVLADPEGNEACVCTWQGREQPGAAPR